MFSNSYFASLQLIEEEEVEVPVTRAATKESKEIPGTDVHRNGEGKDVKMDDADANESGIENDLSAAEQESGLDSMKV
jgi:hypothetical protein